MKKILFVLMALVAYCVNASVKPRTQIRRVAQTDGLELQVCHVGDGYFSCFQTIDGFLISRDASGTFRYVEKVAQDGTLILSQCLAHNPSDRSLEEVHEVSAYVKSNEYKSLLDRVNNVSVREPISRTVGLLSTAPLSSIGSPRIPIVLVQFSDLKFSVSEKADSVNVFFDKFCNGTNNGVNYTGGGSYGAVRDYFIDQSDSLFKPEFEVIGPVTLQESYTYYGKDSGSYKDVNIKAFYQESIVAARSLHEDWTIFDNDSDGVIDMVYFIYAGEGQNGSDDAYTIWPKEQGSGGTINGVKYGSYGCSNEIYNGSVDGIGTICHELSHALGLPDLYDTNYVAFGMDYWDVMDSGCYCANGKCPCGYSAYEKDFMGWNKLVELSPNNPQTLTLQPLSEGGGGYKIVSKDNPDEYYVLDNRQNTKWDTYAGYSTDKYGKAHGLLVTHVDYLQSSWTSNRVNTNKTHQRVTLIPADGQLLIRNASNAMEYLSSMQGDPYPGIMGVTSLEGERAVLYSGGCMNQPITNIVENADGTVTFDYCVDNSANAIGGQYFVGEAFEIVERGVKAYCDIEVFDVSGLLRYRMEPDEYIELDKGIYLLRFKNGVQKIAIH